MTPDNTKCGLVSIIGLPNAGKSTLLNNFVGEKISIVTHKVQTTRSRVRGVSIVGNTQIVYIDTPGIFKAKRRLERSMVDAAWSSVKDADAVVAVIDAYRGVDDKVKTLLVEVNERAHEAILVLNKVDKVKREFLLSLTNDLSRITKYEAVFMVSASKGDGIEDLQNYIASLMSPGPWLYPGDQLSDLPQRLVASETTREKAYLFLHQELPYSLSVFTEEWKVLRDKSVRMRQVIYVERDTQKAIVLGKSGETIKKIRMSSQKEMIDIFDTEVHLFIEVKVRKNWVNDPRVYEEWGLKFDI
ncbi:MAG: GTPase Era [Alphaproteobacteria bacterium]|nr:GTPase Era [Alphaproteobacteria bacterium]PPR13214.1 MAG: GTPase Era [Alphaproteobacteria bacterium MarineAlpha12_Bin1]